METLNNRVIGQNMFHIGDPRIFELVTTQLQDLNQGELMLVYDMIRLIKQPRKKVEQENFATVFPFRKTQEALKGITGNLSDDIINIEREDRV